MRYFKPTVAVAGLLVAVSAYVFAQAPSGTKKPRTPPPSTAVIEFPAQPFVGTFVPAPPSRATEPVSVPATIELTSGQMLAGELRVIGPLQCETIIGMTGIPVNAIRGIRQHDQSGETEEGKAIATIVLANNDSLTVTLKFDHVQIKTDWGMSAVNVSHIRSILLTIENVEWRQRDSRWTLERKADAAN
jgi:hypothetical protein